MAPGKNVPLVMDISNPIFIADGTMTIDFAEITGEPHINGIEIIYVGPPIVASPPTAPVIPTPIQAPTKIPTKAPLVAPMIAAPTKLPTKTPTKVPTKIPVVAPVPLPVPVPVPVPTTNGGNIVHRINCGSTNQVVVPPNNVVWTIDQYASGGLPYNTCGNVTTSIYCTSRYFRTADVIPYRYNLPVAVSNRTYSVRLHFAEQVRICQLTLEAPTSRVSHSCLLPFVCDFHHFFVFQYHNKINARLFDVFVEGILVVDNLDIYAVAPGGNVPHIVTVSTFVTDGAVTIDLTRNKDNPQINGIEVFDDGAPVPAPTFAPQAIQPTAAPVALPPNSAPVASNSTFQDIVINCGGTSICFIHQFFIYVYLTPKSYPIALFIFAQDRCTWNNLVYGIGVRIRISTVVEHTV